MSTSVERVLNNPYLLADIMRHVASIDKVPNVLSTLCVSRAFRNPHVISEALKSITYIYKPLRDRVTGYSVMSCVDIDHVSGAVERSELKIDGLLCWGSKFHEMGLALAEDLFVILQPSLMDWIELVRWDARLLQRLRDVHPLGPIYLWQGDPHILDVRKHKHYKYFDTCEHTIITADECRHLLTLYLREFPMEE